MTERPLSKFTKRIVTDWKIFAMILFYDLIFGLLLINYQKVVVAVVGVFYNILGFAPGFVQLTVSILLFLVVMGLLIIIYSFFKYFVLLKVGELYEKKLGGTGFRHFLWLNIVALSPIVLILMIFLLLNTTLYDWLSTQNLSMLFLPTTIIIILLIVVVLYVYTVLNYLQVISLREKSIKRIMKQGFKMSLKVSSYGFYWSVLKVILGYVVGFIVVSVLAKAFIFRTTYAYMNILGPYKTIIGFTSYVAIYYILLFNRISFYKNGALSKG